MPYLVSPAVRCGALILQCGYTKTYIHAHKPAHKAGFLILARNSLPHDLQDEENTELPLLRRQLQETEKGLTNMLNAIQQGLFSPATKTRLDELEQRKKELTLAILQQDLMQPRFTPEEITEWISQFCGGNVNDTDYTRALMDAFLSAVYVFDDKIVLTYNYKEGSQTISLKEIAAAFRSDLGAAGAPKDLYPRQGDSRSFFVLKIVI